MVSKKKNLKECIELSQELASKLETMAKIEGKPKSDLLVRAVKQFIPLEIETKDLGKEALYMFLDSKLSYEELVRIIGREKASAAKYTKDIRDKGKEFIETLEE